MKNPPLALWIAPARINEKIRVIRSPLRFALHASEKIEEAGVEFRDDGGTDRVRVINKKIDVVALIKRVGDLFFLLLIGMVWARFSIGRP